MSSTPMFANDAWYAQNAENMRAQQIALQMQAKYAAGIHPTARRVAAPAPAPAPVPAGGGLSSHAQPTVTSDWGVPATANINVVPTGAHGGAFGTAPGDPTATSPVGAGDTRPVVSPTTGMTGMQTAIVVGIAGVSAFYLWKSLR